jgi:hypothetical protein
MSFASSVARLTSSLASAAARSCGELCDVLLACVRPLLETVEPVDVPAEVALDGLAGTSSVRVASLVGPGLLVVGWLLDGSVVELGLEEEGSCPCLLVPLVTCADSDGAAHSAIALSAAMMLIR